MALTSKASAHLHGKKEKNCAPLTPNRIIYHKNTNNELAETLIQMSGEEHLIQETKNNELH